MKTTDDLYAFARHFVNSKQTCLSVELRNTLLGYIRGRNYKALAKCTSTFSSAMQTREAFAALLQIEALFKKCSSFADPARCRVNGYRQFVRSERDCRITNDRIEKYASLVEPYPGFGVHRQRAIAHIARTLGDARSFLNDDFIKGLKLTTGATYDLPRKRSSYPSRLKGELSVTPRCKPYFEALAKYFGYSPSTKTTVWNRVTFVPKNWKTDRTIACEPTANVACQLSLDRFIKRRLLRYGIDLRSQRDNAELARLGSIDGSFATIDLSAASDSFSLNTLWDLFPADFAKIVCDFRSPCYELSTSSKTHRGIYAKVSSMGNGSTFALETLFFDACCRAVGSSDHKVYGDDIAIRTEYVMMLTLLLRHYGFNINTDKTFTAGPFRESCGGNYYSGVDITPFYVRELSKRKPNIAHNINGIVSSCDGDENCYNLAISIAEREKIRYVPLSDDTTTGVHTSAWYCYRMKIMKWRDQSCWYRAHVQYAPEVVNRSSRLLFVWYFQTRDRVEQEISSACITSVQTSAYLKSRQRMVRWYASYTGTGDDAISAFSLYLFTLTPK